MRQRSGRTRVRAIAAVIAVCVLPSLARAEPEIAAPNIVMRPALGVYVYPPEQGIDWSLRIFTGIVNRGSVPLELHGSDLQADRTLTARQCLSWDGPVCASFAAPQPGRIVPGGYQAAQECWGVRALARYELRALDGALVRTGGDVARPLGDVIRDPATPATGPLDEVPVYRACVPVLMGLSAGWSAQYDPDHLHQAIVLTGITDGKYILRSIFDPDGFVEQTTRADDVADVVIEISDAGRSARIVEAA